MVQQCRMYCTTQAMRWCEIALEEGEADEPYVYGRVKSLYAGLMIDIGRGEDILKKQEQVVNANPDNTKEIGYLMELYCRMNVYAKVLELYSILQSKNTIDWKIYYFAAEANRNIRNYEEAIKLYTKCGEIGTDFHDEVEALAICYEKMADKVSTLS